MRVLMRAALVAAGIAFVAVYPESFQRAAQDARSGLAKIDAPIERIAEGYKSLERDLGVVWMRLKPVFVGSAQASETHHGPRDAIEIVRRFEGLALEPVTWANGEIRVGYGHASLETPVDAAHANRLLATDLEATEDAVRAIVGTPLSHAEAQALTSLAHNIGLGAFAQSSVVRHLQAGDKTAAAEAFLVWDSVRSGPDWVPNAALAERRRQEQTLFLGRG